MLTLSEIVKLFSRIKSIFNNKEECYVINEKEIKLYIQYKNIHRKKTGKKYTKMIESSLLAVFGL